MSYADLLAKFHGLKAVVIGDLMVDEYIHGSVSRISPEAPVMVVRRTKTVHLPGGAANVALNLAAFGAEVTVVGVVGSDDCGLEASLSGHGLRPVLLCDPNRVTTRKTRILADDRHQLLRLDEEDDQPLNAEMAAALLASAEDAIANAQLVLLSDYRKGALTTQVVSQTQFLAKRAGALCAANAKPATFEWFAGCDFVTLNRLEASAALGREIASEDGLAAARELRRRVDPTSVVVTLGGQGLAVASPEREFALRSPRVEVSDPAGAGDTLMATAALGAAIEGIGPRAFEVAALAAAAVVRHVGVATPTPADLREIGDSQPGILLSYASP